VGESGNNKQTSVLNAAASLTFKGVCSLTLDPGKYLLWGTAILYRNAATLTTDDAEVCIGTTSASSSGCTYGYDYVGTETAISSNGGSKLLKVGPVEVNISAQTTYYLNASVGYSAGTPQWRGSIVKQRIA
jgi:hypothetical protein